MEMETHSNKALVGANSSKQLLHNPPLSRKAQSLEDDADGMGQVVVKHVHHPLHHKGKSKLLLLHNHKVGEGSRLPRAPRLE